MQFQIENQICAIRKNSNHIPLKQITYNSLRMLKNKLNEILWLLLDEKNKMKISFTKDSNLFICIKWTEASIRYRLFLAKYSKCHICLTFYYLVYRYNKFSQKLDNHRFCTIINSLTTFLVYFLLKELTIQFFPFYSGFKVFFITTKKGQEIVFCTNRKRKLSQGDYPMVMIRRTYWTLKFFIEACI